MIKLLKVENFKCIRKMSEPLKMAPLTILCGTNSSGKSTIIQPLLLLKQSLNDGEKARIELNGDHINLNNFESIKSWGSEDNFITFEFRLDDKVGCEVEFGYFPNMKKITEEDKEKPYLLNLKIFCDENIPSNTIYESPSDRIIFTRKKDKKNKLVEYELFIGEPDEENNIVNSGAFVFENNFIGFLPDVNKPRSMLPIPCIIDDLSRILSTSRYQNEYVNAVENKQFLLNDSWGVKNIDMSRVIFSENERNITYGEYIELLMKEFNNSDYKTSYFNLKDNGEKWLMIGYFIKKVKIDPKYKYLKIILIDIPFQELWKKYIEKINNFLNNFYFIGPLRKDPHVVSTENKTRSQVLPDGSNLPYYFFRNKTKKIEYIPNEYINNNIFIDMNREQDLIKKSVKKSLEDAVNDWVKYLGIAEKIKVEKINSIIKIIKVKPFNSNENIEFNDLSGVSTGVSQVLPIIVQCLAADSGSTIFIQQPELHLHPKVQSRLADFFIAMSLSGRQCIIETHSEHLINRLRLRTCQSLLNDNSIIKDNSMIYYFDKENTNTKVMPIEINEYADYSIWPDGFFDEHQSNSDNILDTINKKMFND